MSLHELKILPSKRTPDITLNPDGIIKIAGRSMITNTIDFGRQIEDWIEEYVDDPANMTRVDFNLEYLPSSNLKFYISILKRIETVKLKNKLCSVNWYYDDGDDDIIEKGEYISSYLDIPFNFIKISDPGFPLI